MKKRLKRLLSMLLVLTMVASFVVTGWAVDEPGGSAPRGSGTELEMEDLDPSTLHVPKLGETQGEEKPAQQPITFNPNDIVRVSIFLNNPGTLDAGYSMEGVAANRAASNYRESLRRQQANVTAAIEKSIGSQLDVKWNMTLAVNAISANVRYKDIPLIGTVSGVKTVILENRYEAPAPEPDEPNTANTGENMVGAWDAWDLGYTGAGSRIAIIDTGIDTAHQSFAEEPFTYSVGQVGATSELMTKAQVQALASQLNSKSGNYVSAKIPYGYNYVDEDTRIDHQDSQSNHGSHVAGIAAANRYIGSAHNDAASTVGAVGMAPDAQLFIMKVFGTGGGAYDSDYMVAIEDAIILDCDVVNLSLGSSMPGFTFSDSYQDILNGLVNKENNEGMVVSISAGNAYSFDSFTTSGGLYNDDVHFHTGGSPGSFINSLCVAAAQNTLTKGTPMTFNGNQKVFYSESTEDSDGNAYTNPKMSTVAGTYNYVYIDATGTADDYSTVNGAVSLSGKIVIVNRGDLSFSEKGNNAASYSPKGMVVANNADGTILMNLADYTGTFPMVSITLKEAEQIKAGGTAHTVGDITYYTGTVQVTDVEEETVASRDQATITDFSSWGVPGSLLMKPEITAPGGDIYSVNGTSQADTGSGPDQYISYSGTSMAAPHITGLSAVVAEYLREHPMSAANADLTANYSTRAIIQSLLMSTATPMIVDDAYLSILQQGAGLVEVSKAINASSVIMMTDEGDTLTVRTGANADGKVKVELGDDPDKAGVYSFGFTVYNLSDEAQTFTLDTDLFTQAIRGEFLSHKTDILPAGGVTYTWNGAAGVSDESHDVNKDGRTDNDDAQAILDYLTGILTEDDIDVDAAEMDGEEGITSYDAYLLIDWEPEGGAPADGYTVAAHDKAEVVVTIKLTAAQKEFLADYANGAYLEGYTYVESEDGTSHTIPILGFYGSWTDPTMFDTMSYVESLYGAEKVNYSGNQVTNYLRVNYGGSVTRFSGNPYMVEDEFPADRLAINSSTALVDIGYNLVRSAGTTGYAVTKLDDDGNVTDIVTSTVTGNNISGLWYYVSQGAWQGTTMKNYSINKTVGSYGFNAGDRFRVGFYAIPEYNAMVVNNSYDAATSGTLGQAGFNTLLQSNVLGNGAFVGYDFTVDNEAPTIDSAALNGSTLSISAKDNLNLAYVAVLSLDGTVKYAEAAPGTDTYTVSFDASDAIANAAGYVAAFAGDYAGNETAVAIKVNDNSHVEKTVYVLTDSLTAGNDYLISEVNTAGTGHILSYTAGSYSNTVTATAVTVKAGDNGTGGKPYIETADVPSTGVWTSSSGVKLMNGSNYLRHTSSTSNTLSISTTNSYNNWTYNASGSYANTLQVDSRYMRYYNNTFSLSTSNNKIYLYVKTTISYDVDPYSVSGVTVTPTSLDLYKGSSADLVAKVTPLTATDRTVTWSSSNNAVATVDQNGHVTAVAAGTATITATSNGDNTKKATCAVTVTAIDKELSAIIWDEEGGVFFSYFNSNNLPNWTKRHNTAGETYLTSALMASTSDLYAATNDLSTSYIYTVNRSSYALTQLGQNYVVPFGMAPVGSSFGGTSYFVYAFAKYLIFGNLQPETDDELGTYSGFPYGLLDLSTTSVGDAYAVAVCAKSRSTTSATYYFLDETGKIWQVSQSYSQTNGITFGTPSLVVDTGISTGLQYNSLYYDGTNIFWTRQVDNVSELVIYNVSSGKLYHAGNFGDGVWPATGLYVDGSIAPASAEDEVLVDLSDLTIQATRDELMTAEVMERFAGEQSKFTSAQPISGGLNIVSGTIKPIDPIEPVADDINAISDPVIGDGIVTIDLIETVAAHNGLYTIEYDPDVLTYSKTTSNPAYASINVDEEKGVITYAFADKETTFPANTAIATVEFKTSCEDTVITAITEECNDQFELSDTYGKDVTGVGHKWGEPTWTWAADNSTATASFVCQNNAEHTTEVEATITSETTAPTCEAEGTIVYTATVVLDGKTYTDTKTVITDAIGHDWNTPTYEWAADNSTVTASRICKNDPTHVETETVTATVTTTAATCEEAGLRTYTATFTNAAFETQTKTEEIPATGHTPGEAVKENEVPATCEEAGHYDMVVYCTVCHEEISRETVTVPAIGHDWDAPTYEWAADNSTVTASHICKNDASHVETETVETTYTVVTEPTTEAEGLGRYTAVFTNGAFETQTKDVVLPKLEPTGYHIYVTNKTKAPSLATTSLNDETLYSGVVTFTVTCAKACVVAVKNGDGTYTKLDCTATESGEHSFTVTVTDADVTIVVALRGDANLDGKVSTPDATMVKQKYLGTAFAIDPNLQALTADANKDGKISTVDATFIKQAYLGNYTIQW